MKRFLYYCLIPLAGAALFLTQINAKEESGNRQNTKYYGTLTLSSEIEGLPIYIDEKQVGVTQKQAQSFSLPMIGVYGEADHEVIIQKGIDATHEYYFRKDFAFNRYIDVQENPIKQIALFISPPQNETYPPINHVIKKRLKPKLLARQTGLAQEVKLKHNSAWNMTYDKSRIYVLSRASKNLYRKSRNEDVEGEFIEVYDKETFAFIDQRQLSFKNETFSRYGSIAVNDDTIYIGDNTAHLLRLDKQSLASKREPEQLAGFTDKISGLKTDNDYLIAFGEGDKIAVFKADKLLYTIDEKENYPHNIKEIHDYSDYNRVNSVTIHNDVLYATNHRAFINAYALEDGRPLAQINTIQFEEEWEYVVGRDINAGALYQDRYLYFSIDYHGLLILDTQTGKTSHIQTVFPKKIVYSELLKDNIDMTKNTDIYKMYFYRHFLLFSEVNALNNFVYAYDLHNGQIVHTFKGHQGDITEMFLKGDRLIGLSHNGMLYRWDLAILEKDTSTDVAN
jgi:hypothetical protein